MGDLQRWLLCGTAALSAALISVSVTSRNRNVSEDIVITGLPVENVPESAEPTVKWKPVVTEKPQTTSAADAESEESTETKASELMVDLSTATSEEICRLDGIGEAKAAAIIAYREENGGFTGKEDLLNVSGIGPETYEAIEEHITVSFVRMTEPASGQKEAEQETAVTEPASTEPASTEPASEDKLTLEELAPIDINNASREELMLLPNVDEEAADAILRLRKDICGFSHVYELLYVDELTQNQVAELAEFVTIGE